MDESILMQNTIRNRSEELQNYVKDLYEWEEEMKRKEQQIDNFENVIPPIRSKRISTRKLEEIRPQVKETRISSDDYKAWDKFDADAACNEIDSESKPIVLTEEEKQKLITKAYFHKDKGNGFVKQKEWEKAIECYTEAIDYYMNEPIFYANRALCQLKLNNYSKAVLDCNEALKLDPTYVKALLRRGASYKELNQLKEAQNDFENVLKFEPNNKESQNELTKVKELIEKNKKVVEKIECKEYVSDKSIWNDDKICIEAISKPPNLRSKKPLKQIKIQEIDLSKMINEDNFNKSIGLNKNNEDLTKDKKTKIICEENSDISIDLKNKVVNKIDNFTSMSKFEDSPTSTINFLDKAIQAQAIENFQRPKNYIQFISLWKDMKDDLKKKFEFLLFVTSKKLNEIFLDFMEADLFVEILTVLCDSCDVNNATEISDYLIELTNIGRFGTMIMFMSKKDKSPIVHFLQNINDKNKIYLINKKFELEE